MFLLAGVDCGLGGHTLVADVVGEKLATLVVVTLLRGP